MADNYIENQYNDYLKRVARKEQARRHRLHKALVAYRNQLKSQPQAQPDGQDEPKGQ